MDCRAGHGEHTELPIDDQQYHFAEPPPGLCGVEVGYAAGECPCGPRGSQCGSPCGTDRLPVPAYLFPGREVFEGGRLVCLACDGMFRAASVVAGQYRGFLERVAPDGVCLLAAGAGSDICFWAEEGGAELCNQSVM